MANYKDAAVSRTSPIDQKERRVVIIKKAHSPAVKQRVKKRVYTFFIGGAGDKRAYPPIPAPDNLLGPHGNIVDVQKVLGREIEILRLSDWYRPFYLGYYEIYGDKNIKKNVAERLPDRESPVFIVGHSLGGWNGAHLSGWLNEAGYHVEMLVTLDPVGAGTFISTTSDIYHTRPKVAARSWINIRAEAINRDLSDEIADFGEQWTVEIGPSINIVVDVNHANAIKMCTRPLADGRTTIDHILESIKKFTQ